MNTFAVWITIPMRQSELGYNVCKETFQTKQSAINFAKQHMAIALEKPIIFTLDSNNKRIYIQY